MSFSVLMIPSSANKPKRFLFEFVVRFKRSDFEFNKVYFSLSISKDLKYLTPPPNATSIEELKSCEAISFVLYRLSTWEKKAAGVA